MKDVVPWFLTEVVPAKAEEAAKAAAKATGEATRTFGERELRGRGPKY
ncbi:MAG: hypothetical protein IPK64_22335 [bacterium]|nr:hypothetical protein [bacterium]